MKCKPSEDVCLAHCLPLVTAQTCADGCTHGRVECWSRNGFPCGRAFAARMRCVYCGHYLSLGPARITPEVEIEIRAAELAETWWLPVWPASADERRGCRAHISHDIPQSPGELAGYLARIITTHEDPPRMFPLCIGTTQLAPTNAQCMRCERYGQRCDRNGVTTTDESEGV